MRIKTAPGHPLRGVVAPPGDKSISHRAALLGSIAEGETRLDNFLVSGVTRVALNALARLGVRWELEGSKLTVDGRGLDGLQPADGILDCGNSATTMRLLAGLLAEGGVGGVLDGSSALRRRPMKRVVDTLQCLGVPIEASRGECAPLRLSPRPRNKTLKAARIILPVPSAQVKSALLLAGLAADGPVSIKEPGPSRDHTERMLGRMGVRLTRDLETNEISLVPPSESLLPLTMAIPGDLSSAAFLIVAALISPGSELRVRDVGLNSTRAGFLEALGRMGADITLVQPHDDSGEPVGDIVVRHSALRGVEVDGDLVVRMIDEFPALAVAASFAEGPTKVRQAVELRVKESDRISSLCRELRLLGVGIEESPDGFTVLGDGRPQGGRLNSHGDHRLAMALAVAGAGSSGPVTVEGAECISESYPCFVRHLTEIGGDVEVC